MNTELMTFGFEGNVLKAYALAVIAHKDDVWHGKEPYYLHCGRVGAQLREWGCSEEVVIAGVLHEIIDDGHLTAEELRKEGFSDYTIELIEAATPLSTQTWETHVDDLIAMGDVVKILVKLADLHDNCNVHPMDRWEGWETDVRRYHLDKIKIIEAMLHRTIVPQ
jgi:(p)ppGpp synthase/HD superfamily hydrolase